eukprot:7034073-Pyramimonas_sp.AAC.1
MLLTAAKDPAPITFVMRLVLITFSLCPVPPMHALSLLMALFSCSSIARGDASYTRICIREISSCGSRSPLGCFPLSQNAKRSDSPNAEPRDENVDGIHMPQTFL